MNSHTETTQGRTPQDEQAFIVAGALSQTQQLKECRWENQQMILANTLLAQVELAQMELKQINQDMSLLMAMENALDVVSEKLAQIRKLIKSLETISSNAPERQDVLREIRNLQMTVTSYEETAEFKGVRLFGYGSIRLATHMDEELYLSTSRLPDIDTLDENNQNHILDLLTNASSDINERYEEVSCLMCRLKALFDGLRDQIETMLTKRC